MSDKTMALIDNEKRRDRFIRRVNRAAWTVTILIVLVVAVLTAIQVVQMAKAQVLGAAPFSMVLFSAMPLIDVLWKFSLLVAGLSTVGIFLRIRTASLTEIQLRLAALEEMLSAKGDRA